MGPKSDKENDQNLMEKGLTQDEKPVLPPRQGFISLQGIRQHNLKNIDVQIPLGEITVITGVSGSGKSSLAFDTLYAEGQRRYVESFSAYARQFLDRMDKPEVEHVDGILPAIAIDQTDRVRGSRSTVGTMTEINDFVKLIFAKLGRLYCRNCSREVCLDTPDTIYESLVKRVFNQWVLIGFPVRISSKLEAKDLLDGFAKMGFRKIISDDQILDMDESAIEKMRGQSLTIFVDRVQVEEHQKQRLMDSLEQAYQFGKGMLSIYPMSHETGIDTAKIFQRALKFSRHYHCPDCDIYYQDLTPNLFSFNHPLGACPTCRGFGRMIDIDLDRVIPDKRKSLEQGAIRPWQTESYIEAQRELLKHARQKNVPTDIPFEDLPDWAQKWVLNGEGEGEEAWYGIRGFFEWLSTKAYKMHIRVLLSKYRSYVTCPDCKGARFKPDTLLVRVAEKTIAQLYAMNVDEALAFFDKVHFPSGADRKVADILLQEVKSRLGYLKDVGLSYLALDRPSKTLSGGEVERVNLTTAIGTNLVNTLFVLDEPSIGLHARDNARLIQILHRLKKNQNTIVLVEHDPDIIRHSDYCIDLGPGAGEAGGQIVFAGQVEALCKHASSLTGKYLSNRLKISVPFARRKAPAHRSIYIRGASQNNLKKINVLIPLNCVVCVTGVSGSGKSTLVEEVLYRGLKKWKGEFVGTPGTCEEILGGDNVDEVILVDQDPIGKTPRSNPATYMKIFDEIRTVFSQTPLAKVHRFGPSIFSFNIAGGRCDHCEGDGYEKIEMQFLSDVYVKCPECAGQRYRKGILEICYQGKNIADVLDLTVTQAMFFFSDRPKISKLLQTLEEIGLGYLRLGQPLNTLSGGESQRLKLAYFMGVFKRTNALFLFDEPTTGLHPEDIRKLINAFERLVEEGHSVLIIEHHLDVIKCSDFCIDLGPEGGDQGGEIVAAGTPEEIAKCKNSYTGQFLKTALEVSSEFIFPAVGGFSKFSADPAIRVIGAREHNLKNIDVRIPRDKMVVITGLSGSGKSTLAYDIVFAEGQRRYIESLSSYARQFMTQLSRPDIDWVEGIPPTVAIEQRLSQGGARSTVATVTELYHFLRLLYSKIGVQHCHQCSQTISSQTPRQIYDRILDRYEGQPVRFLVPMVRGKKGYHKDIFEKLRKLGISRARVDGRIRSIALMPQLTRFSEHNIDAVLSEFEVSKKDPYQLKETIESALRFGKSSFFLSLSGKADELYSLNLYCPRCEISFEELDPKLFSFNSRQGGCSVCSGLGFVMKGLEIAAEADPELNLENFKKEACPECLGRRLKPSVLAVLVNKRSIAQVTEMSCREAHAYFNRIKLGERDAFIAQNILKELLRRLEFLNEVGLSYLTLDRPVQTLSGGESQRVRLAAQLGSYLQGVCYILDEPTIGLHVRDHHRLLQTLKKLKDRGNSILIVEHDEQTILAADYVIDLGPGAGKNGGTVVAQGSPKDLMCSDQSVTGHFLKKFFEPRAFRTRSLKSISHLTIRGAKEHNLKNIDVKIPIGRLVCVTGVSGSGKSTLVRDILYRALRKIKYQDEGWVGNHVEILGHEAIERVIEVDQTPIGKTPRSIPATYVGFYPDMRELFVMMPEAKIRGYNASRFSFNLEGGRCEKCQGQGRLKIEMSFLPEVYVVCDECHGKRFNEETLEVTFKGKNIAEILAMSIQEGAKFFENIPKIHEPLKLLDEMGLGYLELGQPSPTLSGGEAQRLKLAHELIKRSRGKTLYILDEPTTGLHFADIEKLMKILQKLVDLGNTVILIEHNLDVIRQSDFILDLGPEGGAEGGQIVVQGSVREVLKNEVESYTAKYLKEAVSRKF